MAFTIRIALLAGLFVATGCSVKTHGSLSGEILSFGEFDEGRGSLAYPSLDDGGVAEPAQYPEISVPNEPEVNEFVSEYFNNRKGCLAAYRERRQAYGQVVEQVFRRRGLPEELIHLAMVESAFLPEARSNKGAVGMWQFIAATAKRYGLQVTRKVDERKDIEKASEAAANHLADLYNTYGDWPLALAAYNSGSGTVNRALEKSGSRDFFSLARKKLFPKETRDYVAKFLAIALIHRDRTPYLPDVTEQLQLARAQ